MTVEPGPMRVQAEQDLIEHFAYTHLSLPGGQDVTALRSDAFSRFKAAGLPHRRIEAWKYTDLRALMREAYPIAELAPTARVREAAQQAADRLGPDTYRIVIANGRYHEEASVLPERDVVVRPLEEVLASGTGPEHLVDLDEIARDDAMIALNTAFVTGGAIVEIADQAKLDRPIAIVSLCLGQAPAAVYSRAVVRVGAGAKATLIEHYAGDPIALQTNHLVRYDLAASADVKVVRLQQESADSLHVATVLARVGANARLGQLVMATGAAVSRLQSFVTMAGEGGVADLRGVALVCDRQHRDLSLTVDHAVPGCESRERFKTVVADSAKGAFQGKIIVRPDAQKTDGQMMSQALLLSPDADFANKPELEIFADDVQCAHGATCGELDQNLLFYLLARGIPRQKAERMLIVAFLAEVVEDFDAELGPPLMDIAQSWLTAREEATA